MNLQILDLRLDYLYGPLTQGSPDSAGYDLRAANLHFAYGSQPLDKPFTIYAGMQQTFGTGLAVHIADRNCVGVVASRSGLYTKHGIRVGQGTGTIDADYTGEILVALRNDSQVPYEIQPMERIAQIIFQPVIHPEFTIVNELDATQRGAQGFGHSGRV